MRYVKEFSYTQTGVVGMGIVGLSLSLFLVIAGIEHKLSGRVTYKDLEQLIAERERLIKNYHAQEITIKTLDGELIAGLLIERPQATRIFVICHGYRSCKERLSDFVDLFPDDTLLFIDLRGHGESSGSRASLGLAEYYDALAAFQYAKDHVSATLPLFGLGISLGGSALLRAAAAGALFDGIITDSAPTEFKDMIKELLWRRHKLPHALGRLALSWYEIMMNGELAHSNCNLYAKNITCPVLILHDRDDTVVDYSHASALYKELGSARKQFITVTGTYHGRLRHSKQQYKEYVEQFIETCRTH